MNKMTLPMLPVMSNHILQFLARSLEEDWRVKVVYIVVDGFVLAQ